MSCNSFLENIKQPFWEPEVFINGLAVETLIDTGASWSVMSLKFFKNDAIKSLQIILKPSKKIFTMANGSQKSSEGQVEVLIEINRQKFLANPHEM